VFRAAKWVGAVYHLLRACACVSFAGLFIIGGADSSPAFDFDYELGVRNPMMKSCTQQTLSPALVVQNCTEFLKWFRDVDTTLPAQAQALYFIGTAYVRAGKKDEATTVFQLALGTIERVLHEHPIDGLRPANWKFSQIFNNRCWIKAISGIELETAIADCDQALTLSPNDPDTRDARAFVLYRQRKFKDALAAYDALLVDQKDYVAALFMRGVIKLVLGDEGGADADIKAAREKDPNIDIVYAGYGIKVK
jgi:tetratricopeptide (TPR) repeat protein